MHLFYLFLFINSIINGVQSSGLDILLHCKANEKIAYVIYQMANIGIFIYFFLSVIIDLSWQFCLGLLVYLLGLGMCIVLVKDFSPRNDGLNTNEIYRFLEIQYMSYFIFF